MKLFHSIEETNESDKQDSIFAARKLGYDVQQVENDGHVLCGIQASGELIDIFPDGSWEYENADSKQPVPGSDARMLQLFFQNKDLYIESMSA